RAIVQTLFIRTNSSHCHYCEAKKETPGEFNIAARTLSAACDLALQNCPSLACALSY
ncbi:hypothetical protein JMJ77_0009085, partial [Colletotrichum scovillei]